MLFDREDINRIELLDIVEPFIVSLLQSDNYISKTEHLILKVTEYLTEIPAVSYNIPELFLRLHDLLGSLSWMLKGLNSLESL